MVDDDPHSLRLLTMRLAAEGFRVLQSADGLEALELIRKVEPDLVVSDVLLPGMDGFEIARQIKEDPRLDIPVVLLSAFYVTDQDMERGLQLGAEQYYVKPDLLMTKPVEGLELVAGVRALLDGVPVPAASRELILVVDDDARTRRLLQMKLGARGYRISLAESGREGLERFAAEKPDLVLLDIQMPQMDGLQVLEELKRREPKAIVVMMTAYGSERIAVRAMKKGANDYLAKPFDLGELELVIREGLERRRLQVHSEELEVRLKETSRDLFERLERLERVNEQLRQNNIRIAEADRLKGEFLANMSHELRTPLNSILGFSRLLMQKESNPEIVDDLEAIHGCGQHLLALIDEILDLAKIEAGILEIEPETFDVGPLLVEVITSLRGLLGGKEVRLETEVAEALPRVCADPRRVRQVLVNLLGNAIKFTEKGYVALRAWPDPQGVLLEVEDSGPGISAEHHAHVFERFSQIAPKDGARGAGMGLQISRNLVRIMDGRIWVESKSGQGACFRFTLPAEPAE